MVYIVYKGYIFIYILYKVYIYYIIIIIDYITLLHYYIYCFITLLHYYILVFYFWSGGVSIFLFMGGMLGREM